MYKNFFVFLVLFIAVFTASLVLTSGERLEAENDSPYPEQGVRAGVWNNGQAALWDLNIIDHFHYFGPEERARGYKPAQPIQFSHVTHVQKNEMDCQYCHWTVAKSPYAAIPEVETCMGCHTYIKGSTETQKAEIEKLNWYWKNSGIPFYTDDAGSVLKNDSGVLITPAGEEIQDKSGKALRSLTEEAVSIPWEKVHVMPNYQKFNHKRHVKAGVSCHSCHGQIPEMEVVERVSSMKMGWCISCHREEGTSIDCATCHY